MRRRAAGKNEKSKWYADRGIGVCKRWHIFENFLADMGVRQQGTTLDRIDNNKGYEPSNCRWATTHQQMQNKRTNVNLTHNGKTQCITAWARDLGMVRATLEKRLAKGWPIERVLTTKRFHEQSGRWGHK